jgi:hypothetical protein
VGQSQTRVEVCKLDLLTGRRPIAVVVERAGGVVVDDEVICIGCGRTDVEEISRQRAGCRQFGEDRVLQPDLVDARLEVGRWRSTRGVGLDEGARPDAPDRARQAHGRLTDKFLTVLRVLLYEFHNAGSGRCFPSYDAIAPTAAERPSMRRSTRSTMSAS